MTPSISVISKSLLDLSSFAIAPAAVSALILNGLLSFNPIGAITGISLA